MNVCLFAPEKYSHVLSYVRVWRLLFCRAYETLAQLLCDSLRCKKCCTNTNSLTYLLSTTVLASCVCTVVSLESFRDHCYSSTAIIFVSDGVVDQL